MKTSSVMQQKKPHNWRPRTIRKLVAKIQEDGEEIADKMEELEKKANRSDVFRSTVSLLKLARDQYNSNDSLTHAQAGPTFEAAKCGLNKFYQNKEWRDLMYEGDHFGD